MTRLLLSQHLADLRRSALTDATIEAAGFYSETDPAKVARILRWERPATSLGPCLVLPYRGIDGTINGYARIKPDHPRIDKEKGKPQKYEAPRGKGESPRAYFTIEAIAAIREKRALLAIAEGEKKGSAASQAGTPTIALPGVWQGFLPKCDPRRLSDDLAAVDWTGRIVLIIFDTDSRRNPDVNYAAAELARVLSLSGAIVVIVHLPPGPRGADGIPGKMGADDFIVAYGEQAFRELILRCVKPASTHRGLDEYRSEILRNRVASVQTPGVYFDGAPTGAGKSTADISAARVAGTSLTVLPVHRVCEETADAYLRAGLSAAAYPELNEKTCPNYEEASTAIGAGLSASAAICLVCGSSGFCDYRSRMVEADEAAHRIATHRRAELSFESIADGCKYIAIHEEPTNLLRPVTELTVGLEAVAKIARDAGQTEKMDLRQFFWAMESAALWLKEKLEHTDDTTALVPPAPAPNPRGIDLELYRAMQSQGKYPLGDATRICKAIAAGELAEIVVRVDRIFGKGGEIAVKKSAVAVWQTKIPGNAATWICDATADFDEIQALVGRPVVNMTAQGTLETRHDAIQVPVDVKQSTSPGSVVKILQAVLATVQAQRIGVIAHKCHLPTIKGTAKKGPTLPEAIRARFAKVEHFRSGMGRGSNCWLSECDLILVVGTPRVPPAVVRTRLIQRGLAAAAARDTEWTRDYWSGVVTSGKRVTVRTSAYRDRDWHQAYQAIVRAELLQAVGRGRGICPNGIPAIVLSNEPLGLPLADADIEPLGNTAIEVLQALAERTGSNNASRAELSGVNPTGECTKELSGVNPTIYNLGFTPLSSLDIAVLTHKNHRWVIRILGDLLRRGLVERIGQRGGWRVTAAGVMFVSTPAPSSETGAAADALSRPAAEQPTDPVSIWEALLA